MNKRVLGLSVSVAALAMATPALADDLTLRRVMLSTGGVGYFEYEAVIDGSADLSVSVPVDQIDDVLKSVVVYDSDGGVGSISLPGREPLREAFRNIPFGPAALDSPAALLDALRGTEIRVTGTREMTGRILAVVTETFARDGGVQGQRNRVSLLTATGVRQFVLEEVDSLEFTDPSVQADLDRALAAVSANEAGEERTLSIRMTGEGVRTVRVAYVVEAPLWKTSYRLTVPADPAQGTADLQGWAILENMSGEDWTDVDLTVVSGNPVTFQQALYDSYYVDRAYVPVEVLGRVLPGIDGRARPLEEDEYLARFSAAPAPAPMAPAMAAGAAMDMEWAETQSIGALDSAKLTAAESAESTTQVLFRVPEPVTVASGHSLLVPVVDRSVPADLVALYQRSVHATHPLASVHMTNDGETGLPPGIITLYERDTAGAVSYIGDARLGALPAGESRLLSFAVDQKVEVDARSSQSETITRVSVVDGLFTLTRTQRETARFTVTGAAREDRVVMIETPRNSGWRLVSPSPSEVELVGGTYRIRRPVEAGTTVQIEVVQERPYEQVVDLSTIDSGQIGWYLNQPDIPDDVMAALEALAAKLGAIRDAEERVARLEAQIAEIADDQGRLRANLEAVPETSDLHQRYLARLDETETAIETLRETLGAARDTVTEARAEFVAAARALTL